jgi:ribosomal-protein-alanine N-acetyltransferase
MVCEVEKKRLKLGDLTPLWMGELALGCEQRLAEIDQRGNRPPWSAASFVGEFSNSRAIVFGARFRGEIIGFGVIHFIAPEAHLLNFAIAQEFRAMGAGRQLLEFMLATLKARGCDVLTLEVRRSNLAAQALYESFGFEAAGERKRYYPDDSEDALVMRVHMTGDLTGRAAPQVVSLNEPEQRAAANS